jgi:tetratricopeptide (TPR) repeat protein
LKEASGAEKASIEAEMKATLDNASRDRNQAIQLLTQSIRLYRSDDAREDLLTARFYVAYLLMKQERFWEAVAVAEFVARSGPGTETGLKASAIALFGFNNVIQSLPDDRKMSLLGSLESMAQYMIGTWPDAEETKQATLTLLQYALQSKRWDEAERFLTLLPKKGSQSSATRRDLGYVLWIQYLLSVDDDRKTGKEPPTGDVDLRHRAERMLAEGWEGLELESLDQRAVEAAGALAAIYLRTERREQAEAILEREKIGPVAVIGSPTGPVKDPKIRLEILRLKLQTKVMAAGSGATTLDPREVESLVKAMQAAAGKEPKLLTNTLFILAKELQEQLTRVEKPADKAKLAGGFLILLTQLADISSDPGMLDWAGTTLWQLGTGLRGQAGADDIAKKLSGGATQVFQKMIDANEKDPKYLEAIQRKPDDILIKQGIAFHDQAEYQKAADLYIKILKGNSNHLTAQREAARNYQAWAAGNNVDLLKKALLGTEPDQRQKNTVWGWGTMSKTLSSQMAKRDDLKKIFFEARLELSTCRRLIAKTMPAGEQTKTLEQALGEVRQTYLAYPELGGKESSNAFDKLLRSLQGDLGRPAVGFKEFEPNPNPNPNANPNPK